MQVYRIEKNKYIDIFPPKGSLFSDGRWNRKDMWVEYTSENIALAKLEALANCGIKLPKNRFLRIIEIRDDAPIVEITSADLPADWNATPYPQNLATIIKRIIDSKKYVAVIVPSAQSNRERNILLFPDYPKFDQYVKQVEMYDEDFDSRLK